ncbi:MAG: tetratricopeptide repeat protein [Myxococcaceae bacterium]
MADGEFHQNLYKGGELLAAGKVIEAKDYLERAHALKPKNEKGQNLLGLAYFKLGLFDRAAEIYEALVRENPVDPTLRVNLGLVYLKTNALARAIREFETSCDLAPDHKKAHNYLGLALAQLGNYAEAKEHFIAAGSDAMAEKMERALSGEATGLHRMPAEIEQQVLQERAPASAQPPAEELTEAIEEVEVEVTEGADADWGAQFDAATAASEPSEPPPADDVEIRFAEDEGPTALGLEQAASNAAEESVVVTLDNVPVSEAQPAAEVHPLAPMATSGIMPLTDVGPALDVLRAAVVAPFEIRDGSVAISVGHELMTRIDGLLLSTGQVQFEPELKRFRGRSTEQPFGEGLVRMMRATGHGVLVLSAPEKQVFVALELAGESAYFREDHVFAFEEPVAFENGRVPSEEIGDLDLVHLRGNGQVLLKLPGALRSHQIRMDQPSTVPLARLVGWYGNLTPRLVSIAHEESGALVAGGVELSGEGFVLFSATIG